MRLAHLIIDVQNRYFAPRRLQSAFSLAAMPSEGMRHYHEYVAALPPRIDAFAAFCRRVDVPNIYVHHAVTTPSNERFADIKPDDIEALNALRLQNVHEGDLHVFKKRHSAFDGTNLRALLAEREIEGVILSGGYMNQCVLQTATDAIAECDLEVVLAHDLLAMEPSVFTFNEMRERLKAFTEKLGALTSDVDHIVKKLGGGDGVIPPMPQRDRNWLHHALKGHAPAKPSKRQGGPAIKK